MTLLIIFRSIHYPPESHNIMLLCRLLATIELSPSPQQANQIVSNVIITIENIKCYLFMIFL